MRSCECGIRRSRRGPPPCYRLARSASSLSCEHARDPGPRRSHATGQFGAADALGVHLGDERVDELERREVAPVRRVLLPQRHVLMEGRCHHAPISITMSPPADAARYAVRNLCARRMIPLGSRESKCTFTHSPAARLVCSSYSRLVGGSGQRHLLSLIHISEPTRL